ncbi:two component system sensor histidine kinase [Desulfosarcina variabilis str. Montpellier]
MGTSMKTTGQSFFFACMIGLLLSLTASPASSLADTLRVGVRSVAPPLCFLDDTVDKPRLRGMNIDIMEQVRKLMKARIVYVDIVDLEHRWEMLEKKRIDAIVLSTIAGHHLSGVHYIPVGITLKRRIYVHQSCKTVVCNKDLRDKRVGILIGEGYSRYPKMGEAVAVTSELEGLQKLNRGELDAMIVPSEMIAEYHIQKKKLTHVRRVGMVLDLIPLYIAVRADDDQLYVGLSDAIKTLEERGVMQSIKEKWHGVAFPLDYWSQYGRLILIGIGLTGLALCAVLFWNHQLKRQIRKVTLNLQISESKSRALIESSPDMIFVINPQGDIVNANKEARYQILGDAIDPQESSKLIDFAVEGDKAKLQAFIASIFTQGQAATELSFHNTTRQIRELSIAASRIANDDLVTEPVACFFARDVTDRNRIERELVQADRMAMIGQMAAGVAHEINNPLGIVRANLELIASRGWFAEDANDFVDAIRRNTERAGKITKDLLAVTKPGNAVMTAVNLRELVELTLNMIRPQLKKVTIERQDIGDVPVVYGDRHLLQQVLVNLFLNAKDAMNGCDAPVLTVTCCSNPKEALARVKIMDNGPGIDKAMLLKIFDPFFTHAKKEGFGLGLFISQRIIERHNGMIYAESEKGKGAQMIIELPLTTTPNQTGTVT